MYTNCQTWRKNNDCAAQCARPLSWCKCHKCQHLQAGPNLGQGKRGSCPRPHFSEGLRASTIFFFIHTFNVGYRYRPVPDQVDGPRDFIEAPRIWSVATPDPACKRHVYSQYRGDRAYDPRPAPLPPPTTAGFFKRSKLR